MGVKKPSWAFFGSSLVSAYWNGAATYYRGLIKALAERGHQVSFYEPDAYDRQKNRDMEDPEWARSVVYEASPEGLAQAIEEAKSADFLVKASGVGVFDEELEKTLPELKSDRNTIVFWDVDAPATLSRMQQNPDDPFRKQVSRYDLVCTYGGGDPVVSNYEALGARRCVPVYNALDPSTHFPVKSESRFSGLLGFLGNRLPDREKRVEDFFLKAANDQPESSFLLGGSGWGDKGLPSSVRYLGHVYTHQHNAFNSSVRAVLNLSRDSMAMNGFSPATRVFEAAGAGACLITDAWKGIEMFLEPDMEVLVARDGSEVREHVSALEEQKSRLIGARARKRILAEHTYAHRAALLEEVLGV